MTFRTSAAAVLSSIAALAGAHMPDPEGATGAPAAEELPPGYHVKYEESEFLTRIRRLTYEGRRAGEGYYSADGSRLVFQSERDPANPFFQIFELDFTTGDTKLVSPGLGKTTCSYILGDTATVLYASTHLDPESLAHQEAEIEFRASGEKRRYSWDYDVHFDLFAADGAGNHTRLTDAYGYDAEGSYSPDGKLIAFCSMRDGYVDGLSEDMLKQREIDPSFFGEIYIMNADGSEPRRLTNTPGYDGGPFFTADGERIVWRRFDEKGFIADIFTMKLDGSGVVRVTDFGCMSWAPYCHPSGEYFIFGSNKEGFSNFELYIVDHAGTRQPVRVTTTDGFDGLPVFSPDGRDLCWTSTRHGGENGQLFLARWNHEMALKALAAAPERINHSERNKE